MNVSSLLVNAVVGGVLGGGRKRTRNVSRYLASGRGSGWANPSLLITAAGVAWGVFETLQQSGAIGGQPASAPAGPASTGWSAGVPPLPVGASEPASAPISAPAAGPATEISPHAVRVVRLAVSAANADGAMNDRERDVILERARAVGLADFVEREVAQPRPLREIVEGVSDTGEAATLYVLAFAILRADESVQPTERVFLAQLASFLRLDPSTVELLERDTGARIDAAGDVERPVG